MYGEKANRKVDYRSRVRYVVVMKRTSEEVISMFLGLVIVVAVIGLVFSYFQRKRGSVDIPGTTTENLTKPEDGSQESETVNNREYVVVANDSLWKIAEATYGSGYNWVDIQKANNLKNPGHLTVGQKLVLPGGVQVIKPALVDGRDQEGVTKIETGTYQVIKNDNLWQIAVRTYGDGYQWTKIWDNNRDKLRSPDELEIGMVLTLPEIK